MYLSHNIVTQLLRLEITLTKLSSRSISDKELARAADQKLSQSIFYVAASMGVNITLKEAEKLIGDKSIDTGDFRGSLLTGFRKAYRLVESLANSEHIGINSHVLSQINYTLGKDSTEDWKLKYRESADQLPLIYEDLLDIVPAENKNINAEQAVIELTQKYNEASSQTRLYRFSQLYYELIRLHPFMAFNRYSLILIGELLFSKISSWQLNLVSFAELFGSNNITFLQVLDINDQPTREVAWHESFLSRLADMLEKAQADMKMASPAADSSETDRPFLDLNKRQLKILKYLQTIPTVRREDYVQMTNVSAMTAYRDLNMLVTHKLLKTYGTGRGTKYMLSSR